MMKRLVWKHAVLVLLVISFSLHFWGLEQPNEVVFDEVHFGKFASSYLNGSYHFDIHPPLGKIILAAGSQITGFKPGFGFNNIGDKYPDNAYYGLRLFPALAGSLIPLVIYLILRTLGISKKNSILGMLMTVLENSILIQSKFILIDAFLLLFGLLSILFYLKSRERAEVRKKVTFLLLSGLFAGASFSIKWTGLVFFFLVFALASVSLARHVLRRDSTKIKPLILFVACFILVPVLVYTSVFALHFSLLPYSGSGDAFMSQGFQSTLKNSQNYNPDNNVGFAAKFIELNKVMFSANSGITATHPYSISWYYMPTMHRSLYYWTRSNNDGSVSRVYLLGNPFIWWAVLISIIFIGVSITLNIIKREWAWIRRGEILIFLLLAYLLNMATYAFVSRVIFLYHYFPSLVLGILIFCITTQKLFEKRNKLLIGFLILIIASFIFFSPLTYGWPLDSFSYGTRNWLPSWI